MCVTSMVTDHYQQKYPQPQQWTWPIYHDYEELKRKAALYDELMKQPDCQKPEITEFEERIKDFLEKHYGIIPIR